MVPHKEKILTIILREIFQNIYILRDTFIIQLPRQIHVIFLKVMKKINMIPELIAKHKNEYWPMEKNNNCKKYEIN